MSDYTSIQLLCKFRKITKVHTNDINLLVVDMTFILFIGVRKKTGQTVLLHFSCIIGTDVTAIKIWKTSNLGRIYIPRRNGFVLFIV